MDEIKSERLILKKITADDYTLLFRLWHDSDLIKFTYHQYMETEEESRQKVLKIIEHYNKSGGHYGPYLIYYEGQFAGYCGMDFQSQVLREYEIFYIISREYQRLGFGTEVSITLTDYAFNELAAERVSAEAVKDNAASCRILEKTGMTKEGCLRRKFYKGQDFHDLLIYAVLKDEWQLKTIQPG